MTGSNVLLIFLCVWAAVGTYATFDILRVLYGRWP